jgi:hypothetical protein
VTQPYSFPLPMSAGPTVTFNNLKRIDILWNTFIHSLLSLTANLLLGNHRVLSQYLDRQLKIIYNKESEILSSEVNESVSLNIRLKVLNKPSKISRMNCMKYPNIWKKYLFAWSALVYKYLKIRCKLLKEVFQKTWLGKRWVYPVNTRVRLM